MVQGQDRFPLYLLFILLAVTLVALVTITRFSETTLSAEENVVGLAGKLSCDLASQQISGQTLTYTVGPKQYVIRTDLDGTTARFTINGETTPALTERQTATLSDGSAIQVMTVTTLKPRVRFCLSLGGFPTIEPASAPAPPTNTPDLPPAPIAEPTAPPAPLPPNPTPSVTEQNIEGLAIIIHKDDFENSKSSYDYGIRTTNGERLILNAASLPNIQQGDSLRVRGTITNNRIAATRVEVTRSNIVAPERITLPGTVKYAVIIIDYKLVNVPYTNTEIQQMLFGQTDSVKAFYERASNRKMILSGDIFRTKVSVSGSRCLADDAELLAAAQFRQELNDYDNVLFIVPPDPGCGYNGWASLGLPGVATVIAKIRDDHRFKFVAGHEIGHNLGMYHASTFRAEYGDSSDIMGHGSISQLNAPHKDYFTWTKTIDVSKSGIYTINTLDEPPTAPQVLRVRASRFGLTWYYFSYRTAQGLDQQQPGTVENFSRKMSVHIWNDPSDQGGGASWTTMLVGTYPEKQSFIDSSSGLNVTLSKINGNEASFTVILLGGTVACAKDTDCNESESCADPVCLNPGTVNARCGLKTKAYGTPCYKGFCDGVESYCVYEQKLCIAGSQGTDWGKNTNTNCTGLGVPSFCPVYTDKQCPSLTLEKKCFGFGTITNDAKWACGENVFSQAWYLCDATNANKIFQPTYIVGNPVPGLCCTNASGQYRFEPKTHPACNPVQNIRYNGDQQGTNWFSRVPVGEQQTTCLATQCVAGSTCYNKGGLLGARWACTDTGSGAAFYFCSWQNNNKKLTINANTKLCCINQSGQYKFEAATKCTT